MPSALALTINDATPTGQTFSPRSVSPERTIFYNDNASTSAGQMNIHVGLSVATVQRNTNRVNIRVNVPFEHTVDGVVRVAYTARANIDVVLPEEMTSAQRADFAAYLKNTLANVDVEDVITDLDPFY